MNKFDKRLASVVCHNGEHHIILPSGELFPCVVSTEVKDEVGQKRTEVIIKAKVNIAESIEDAKRKYQDDELVCRIDGEGLITAIDRKYKEEVAEQHKEAERNKSVSWRRAYVEALNDPKEVMLGRRL